MARRRARRRCRRLVRSRDPPRVEVDRPAAEQPVLDPVLLELRRRRRRAPRSCPVAPAPHRRYVTNANAVPSAETCSSRATSSNASAIPCGEEGVAVDVELDLGELELVGEREGGGVDLGATDHVDALLAREESEGVAEASRRARRRVRSSRVSRVTTTLRRPGSGRKRSGSESHVFRPMTTA